MVRNGETAPGMQFRTPFSATGMPGQDELLATFAEEDMEAAAAAKQDIVPKCSDLALWKDFSLTNAISELYWAMKSWRHGLPLRQTWAQQGHQRIWWTESSG